MIDQAGAGDLRAISLTQPWAWALFDAGKDVENRKRRSSHRGTTLIHASVGMTNGYWTDAANFMARLGISTPSPAALERGGIIGAIDFVDCVDASESPWFFGPFAYVVANPRPIDFIPCKGTIFPLFWVPPADVLARARAALGLFDLG